MVITTGPSTPAVSQVGLAPGGGASGNTQRRQGEASASLHFTLEGFPACRIALCGSTTRATPVVLTAPP